MMQATPVRQKPVIVIYYKTVTKCIKREVSMHKRDVENVMYTLYFVFKTGTKWHKTLYIVFCYFIALERNAYVWYTITR